MSKLDGMNNRVDLWNSKTGGILKHVGGGESFQDGLNMFSQACRDYPSHNITLRQGARVIEEQPASHAWSESPFTEAEKALSKELALKVFARHVTC